jgi:GxxExxY protein
LNVETQSHSDTENLSIEFINQKTSLIIGAAIEVHRICGPGLLERVYRNCLNYELVSAGFNVKIEVPLKYVYKNSDVVLDYRLDILVDDMIVLELKSVPKILPVHESQLLSYLRLSNYPCGLLLNFYVPVLTQGIIRKLNFPSSDDKTISLSL